MPQLSGLVKCSVKGRTLFQSNIKRFGKESGNAVLMFRFPFNRASNGALCSVTVKRVFKCAS